MSHDTLNRGTVIKLRRDTETNWATDNPTLEEGETGWATDTRRVKLGDGVTAWNDLPYAVEPYNLAGVELASAEVSYNFPTTFAVSPAQATAVVGAMIVVPATTGPVLLQWGADAAITTAGAGLLQLQVWQGVGSFTIPYYTNIAVIAANVSTGAGASGNGLGLRATKRLDPSGVDRTFFLAAVLYRDPGSGLVATLKNNPETPSYIRAVGL